MIYILDDVHLKLKNLYVHVGCGSSEDHQEKKTVVRTQEQYPEGGATNREDKPALIQVSCAEQPHRAQPESFIVLTLLHKWNGNI